jgi:hypothetical protein
MSHLRSSTFSLPLNMKRKLTLAAGLALALVGTAQPTLTFATNAPVVGTQYTLHYDGEYVPPGSAGASQTWDLTGLSTDSIDVLQLVAPASTTNGDQFPEATVAEISSPVTTYYKVSANGIYFAGSDDGTSIIANAPMPKYLAFPCTMGSSWSSPQAAQFSYDGNDVFRSGTASGAVDGYGTVIMPWGTVQNVLRIHQQNVLQDSLALFTMHYTYDSYLYYVPGQSFPLAELVTATLDMGFGTPQVTQFCRWTEALSTGTPDRVGTGSDLSLYPNPAGGAVTIEMPATFEANADVRIVDATGRVICQDRVNALSGTVVGLDLMDIRPGVYTVLLSDGAGHSAASRLDKR